MKQLLVALVLLAALAGCSGSEATSDSATTAPKKTISGVVALAVLAYPNVPTGTDGKGDCERPEAQFADIKEGAQVLLTDSAGATVATAVLGAPEVLDSACGWKADFDAVPSGGKFYTAEIGSFKSPATAEEDLGKVGLIIRP